MSLKSFHLLFIAVSTILSFGVAAWAIDAHWSRGEQGSIPLAILSLIAGTGLVIYGLRVRAKFRNMEGV